MRGLDKEERLVLDVIAKRDHTLDLSEYRDAIERCRVFDHIIDECQECKGFHFIPILTVEGRTAVACDDASRTPELFGL
jgi:hypothetical protein